MDQASDDMYMPTADDPVPDHEDDPEEDFEPDPKANMITETTVEPPGAFIKFHVTKPSKKKKAHATPKKKATTKRPAKLRPTRKRKAPQPEESGAESEEDQAVMKKAKFIELHSDSGDESLDSEKKVEKGRGKGRAKDSSEEPEDPEITAYIFVERPVLTAPARSASSARAHKPTDEEKHMACGLILFSTTISYQGFLVKLSKQLPCAVDDIVQEKITWKPQTPLSSRYLALGGEIGFASMVKQNSGKKSRVILLAMPPPMKPRAEKPFWSVDGNEASIEKIFDYGELELVNTHDHVVEKSSWTGINHWPMGKKGCINPPPV